MIASVAEARNDHYEMSALLCCRDSEFQCYTPHQVRKLLLKLRSLFRQPGETDDPPRLRQGLILLAAILVGLALWKIPERQARKNATQFTQENAARTTLAQILGGSVLLAGLYISSRTFGLSRQGQITDRFTKAIEQLGKTDGTLPNIEVRLGAIYALERIALDSPRDHWTIMEILTAYVRQNAPLRLDAPYIEGEKPRTDIQAILTVLGRRRVSPRREHPGRRLDLTKCHLDGASLPRANLQSAQFFRTSLQGAYLDEANLDAADLRKANLQRAILERTSLKNADLSEANLQRAYLPEANLLKADLSYSNMQRASLMRANLQGAYLLHANLEETNLVDANLRSARSLSPARVQTAAFWQQAHYSTELHNELRLPPAPSAETTEASVSLDRP